MNAKKMLSLLMAVVLTLSLVACGSGKTETPSAEEAETTTPPATEETVETVKTASGLPALTKEEIHIGAVFNTEIGTEGFSYALGMGFKALEDAGYKVTYALAIPESSESETAMESPGASG